MGTCSTTKAAGYGPEYYWYRDGDNDGIVCE